MIDIQLKGSQKQKITKFTMIIFYPRQCLPNPKQPFMLLTSLNLQTFIFMLIWVAFWNSLLFLQNPTKTRCRIIIFRRNASTFAYIGNLKKRLTVSGFHCTTVNRGEQISRPVLQSLRVLSQILIHVNPSCWTWGRFGFHFREIEVCIRETIRWHF